MKTLSAFVLSTCLAGAAARAGPHLGPVEVAQLPASAPTATVSYGPQTLQFGELRLPAGRGPFPVAVIIHGGCFSKGFATLSYMRPLASDLARRGIATWNIEYRQMGDLGGGWPGTFEDWAAAADYVRTLAKRHPLDLSRVVVAGHSAGATAALWLAARPQLAHDHSLRSKDPLALRAAVAIDGPADLTGWIGTDANVCHRPVIVPLFGGTPREVPERYAAGDPARMPVPAAQVVLVTSMVMMPPEAERFREHDGRAQIIKLEDAGHFDMLAPDNPAYAPVAEVIQAIASPRTESPMKTTKHP